MKKDNRRLSLDVIFYENDVLLFVWRDGMP